MKKKLTIENILCVFVILCPIFDIMSFIFRNTFDTKISISTFLRPIIPVIVSLYIFIKSNKKEKKFFIIVGLIYVGYALAHLAVTKTLLTGASYGGMTKEAQYILNFTFLAIYLVIYLYTFIYKPINSKKTVNIDEEKNSTDILKLRKSIVIMCFIYVASIIIAIITKTSSYTYIETSTGYKGWIESGNSLSAILLLSSIITLCEIKENKSKFAIVTFILTVCYLAFVIGTRTGLLGTFLIILAYIILEIIFSKNKKAIIVGAIVLAILASLVGALGSTTIKRRKQMNTSKYTIIDEKTGEVGTMTGDMLRIKNKILDGTLEEGYMSEAQKQSVINLYNYSQKHNFEGNDTRRQQLVYNVFLVKNQKNVLAIIFGNGYETNFREMVMENELASMLLNFGIVGFCLYVLPLFVILIYSVYIAIKNRKKLNTSYVMYQMGLSLALVLSWMSGYVLFATSSMIVIVVLCVQLLNETKKVKET